MFFLESRLLTGELRIFPGERLLGVQSKDLVEELRRSAIFLGEVRGLTLLEELVDNLLPGELELLDDLGRHQALVEAVLGVDRKESGKCVLCPLRLPERYVAKGEVFVTLGRSVFPGLDGAERIEKLDRPLVLSGPVELDAFLDDGKPGLSRDRSGGQDVAHDDQGCRDSAYPHISTSRTAS